MLLAALSELGVDADDLAGVAVTHIHLDHAGGVGDVARAFPGRDGLRARERRPAPRRPDPPRPLGGDGLRPAARFALRPPRPDTERPGARPRGRRGDRPRGWQAPERDRLAGPRQAPPRAARLGQRPALRRGRRGGPPARRGRASAGDTAPDFDLELALGSLRRFADTAPSGIALLTTASFPPIPRSSSSEAEATLRSWADEAERAWRAGEDIAEALQARFSTALDGMDPETRRRLETLNGVHSNAAGLRRWLEQRAALPEP